MPEWNVRNLTPAHAALFQSSSLKEGYLTAVNHSVRLALKEEDIRRFHSNREEAEKHINENKEILPSLIQTVRELEKVRTQPEWHTEYGLKNAAEIAGYIAGLGAALDGKRGVSKAIELGIQLAKIHPEISGYVLGRFVLPLLKVPHSVLWGEASDKLKIYSRMRTKAALRSLPEMLGKLIEEAQLDTDELRLKKNLAQKGVYRVKQISERLSRKDINAALEILRSHVRELEEHKVPVHSLYRDLESSIKSENVERAKNIAEYMARSIANTIDRLEETIKAREEAAADKKKASAIFKNTPSREIFKEYLQELSPEDSRNVDHLLSLDTEHLEKIEEVLDRMGGKLNHLLRLSRALKNRNVREVIRKAIEIEKMNSEKSKGVADAIIEAVARGDPDLLGRIREIRTGEEIDELFEEIRRKYQEK